MNSILSVVPIEYYLGLSVILFTIGVMGVLFRRNAIIVFMCIELMLNAVNINLAAFWHYYTQLNQSQTPLNGMVFLAIVFIVAAAETAVGLALIISAYRRRNTSVAGEMDLLKG